MSSHLKTSDLKEHNTSLIKNALRNRENATKKELQLDTGLSIASCTTILSELITSNEVIELKLAKPQGGRPARRFQYNADYKRILLLSLTKEDKDEIMHLYVTNLLGKIESKTVIHEQINIDVISNAIKNQIMLFNNIGYVSVGIPGVVQNGRIHSCDIHNLTNSRLGKYISSTFNVGVNIENDVNAIAIGYYNDKEYATSPESIVYLYYPSNGDPGAGFVINGTILHGVNNLAGEIKHLPTNSARKLQQRITQTIQSIQYIINPQYFVISGKDITSKDKENISSSLLSIKIHFEDDISDHYLSGLLHRAYKMV